jgi:hypothetical protein
MSGFSDDLKNLCISSGLGMRLGNLQKGGRKRRKYRG